MATSVPVMPLNDGNSMPQLGLGVWQVPNSEASAAVQAALAAGYRSVDTAAIYGNEAGVGEGLKAAGVAREALFVTTKLWNDRHHHARQALEESLRKLDLDYVDLYLIHWPVAGSTAFVDAWRTMIELREAGLTRSIGVSNFTRENLTLLMEATDVIPAVNQIELHPGFAQRELRAFHADHGIATESWSPLGQGVALHDDTIGAIARSLGKSAAQVILRWHLQSGLIVIPKSVTPARIRANIDVFDFDLSSEDMQAIDGLPTGKRLGPDPAVFKG
ncbi:aldo/keto reductase [Bordetella hinzii]|uniref:aldo/keto reductase n=1 Tax=Bordetella hinzii TaxID=103855 RepID=UPI00045968E7|nr:aldo/keto reductase [Bordetella hinzii]KCB42543.1 2,5-diketo-D-gluconic acid reductase A [Bordetella hinzii 4161]KXA74721.1 oxidoreductase [Bordetella hinzii LMG 13501]VEH24489.1 oxidoreductase [Bordetella hinzii]